MVQVLEPRDAEARIARGGVRIIDVREPAEWQSGHVPGAENIPLEDLRSDPSKLPTGPVLYVCARGMRSMTAAKLAEGAGRTDVMSLEGGTSAWASAGLRTELAVPETSLTRAARDAGHTSDDTSTSDDACGLPEPGLDAVVGENMKALRAAKGLSLDTLAKATGLSRTLLGQVELGKTSPSVSLVWKLAQAFDVPFSAMLSTSRSTEISVLRAKQAKRIVGGDGRFSSRALFPAGGEPGAEFYELYLAPHSREDAGAHRPGTRENLIVASGRLELHVGAAQFELAKGDAIVFGADVPHAYVNNDKDECWLYLVMTYATAT